MKKTVLITGGSKGIGRATVYRLAKQGHKVIFTYNTGIRPVQKILTNLHECDIEARRFSLGDLFSQSELIEKLPEEIDVLINNAGVGSATVLKYSDNEYEQDRKLMEINALGNLWLTESIIPMMKEKGGKIINISSVCGGIFHYPGFKLADGMSKAALTFMTKQLAAEHAHTNIDIFAVCPGAVDTEMFQSSTLNHLSDKEREEFINNLPKKRLIKPDEIASICEFLAGDQSQFLHGAVIDASMGLGVSPALLKKENK